MIITEKSKSLLCSILRLYNATCSILRLYNATFAFKWTVHALTWDKLWEVWIILNANQIICETGNEAKLAQMLQIPKKVDSRPNVTPAPILQLSHN